MQEFVGKTLEAITLNAFDGEWTEALTENYLPLRLRGKSSPNRWLQARVEDVTNGNLVGAEDSGTPDNGAFAVDGMSSRPVSS